MKRQLSKINVGVDKIQSSSPKARMRWAIALTTVTTLIIFFVWFQAFESNLNIPRSSPLAVERVERKDDSLIEKLRVRTAQTILYFQTKFKEKNEISIDINQG